MLTLSMRSCASARPEVVFVTAEIRELCTHRVYFHYTPAFKTVEKRVASAMTVARLPLRQNLIPQLRANIGLKGEGDATVDMIDRRL